MINGDFKQLNSDNETLMNWESLGNVSFYRISSDFVNGTKMNVLEIEYNPLWDSFPVGIAQSIVLNRNAILPLRIKGTSKV